VKVRVAPVTTVHPIFAVAPICFDDEPSFTNTDTGIVAGGTNVSLGLPNADAGLVTYTDFSSWNAATASYMTVTIPNPSSVSGFDSFAGNSVSYSGVTFSSDTTKYNGGFFNVGPVFSGQPAVIAAQQLDFDLVNILITFAGPVTAFGRPPGRTEPWLTLLSWPGSPFWSPEIQAAGQDHRYRTRRARRQGRHHRP